jgi:hypothetical protein
MEFSYESLYLTILGYSHTLYITFFMMSICLIINSETLGLKCSIDHYGKSNVALARALSVALANIINWVLFTGSWNCCDRPC